MFRLLVVLCCVLSLNGQLLREDHPAPEPYQFAFSSPNDDGTSSSREETGDANGRITGSYTIQGADGQSRRVEYVADENGFRANVITNEIGTESQNAADVLVQSSAPTAAELSHQWEASGAGRVRLAGQGIARNVVREQLNIARGAGLIPAPVAPIGGGFAGINSLRVNKEIRVANQLPIGVAQPLLRPIGRAAHLPLPVAPVFETPVVAPLPVAQPLAVPVAPLSIGGARAGGAYTSFARTQSISPFGTGIIGAGVGLAQPVAVNTLGVNHFGVRAAPLGVNFASVQHLNSLNGLNGNLGVRGLTLGGYQTTLDNGANQFLLGTPKQQLLTGANEAIEQRTELITSNDDYAKKSK